MNSNIHDSSETKMGRNIQQIKKKISFNNDRLSNKLLFVIPLFVIYFLRISYNGQK